jgi:hypothetical protein
MLELILGYLMFSKKKETVFSEIACRTLEFFGYDGESDIYYRDGQLQKKSDSDEYNIVDPKKCCKAYTVNDLYDILEYMEQYSFFVWLEPVPNAKSSESENCPGAIVFEDNDGQVTFRASYIVPCDEGCMYKETIDFPIPFKEKNDFLFFLTNALLKITNTKLIQKGVISEHPKKFN